MSGRPPVNPFYLRRQHNKRPPKLRLYADEMWSYVGTKHAQRWLWWVEDEHTGQVVAYVFGRRTHATFRGLLAALRAAGLRVNRWITDAWGAYTACLEAPKHTIDKTHLQRLERKHLTLRTRLKRLARKTICFSKSVFFHDGIIRLFIHDFFFKPAGTS